MRKAFPILAAILLLLGLAGELEAQVSIHVPTVTSLPTACRVGDLVYKTTATAGLYSCTATNTWTVVGGVTAAYSTVQDEASNLTQRATLNFTGAGVSCADNGGSTRTDCTIAAATGGTTIYINAALLARTRYAPGTNSTFSTTSSSLADLDTTNLSITFTAPASGAVFIRLSAYADVSSNAQQYQWALRTTAPALVSGASVGPYSGTEGTPNNGVIAITGLTPGASTTYRWAHAVTGGATGRTFCGPGVTSSTVSTSDMMEPCQMEVWDAGTSTNTSVSVVTTKAVLATNSGTQNISDSTATTFTLDSESYDNNTMHDTGSNTGRITFTTAGKYAVSCQTVWGSADVDGFRYEEIKLNGTTVIRTSSSPAVATPGNTTDHSLAFDRDFSAADYIECRGFQNSGSTLTATVRFAAHEIQGAGTFVAASIPGTFQARLTTETGVPVSTTDRTAQATIYLTKYNGSLIAAYTGSSWETCTLESDLSLALSSLTSGKNYDVFVTDAGSCSLSLELSAAWTNDTTRADALTTQNGVYVKSGATNKLHVGTLRTVSTSATADSGGMTGTTQVGCTRFLWNRYNPRRRPCRVIDTSGTYTYATGTWRQTRATAGNKVEWVTGDVETEFDGTVIANFLGQVQAVDAAKVAIGIDTTTGPTGMYGEAFGASFTVISMSARHTAHAGLGYHYAAMVEYGGGGSPTHADWRVTGLAATIEN